MGNSLRTEYSTRASLGALCVLEMVSKKESDLRLMTKVFWTRWWRSNSEFSSSLAIFFNTWASSIKWSKTDFCLIPSWAERMLMASMQSSESRNVARLDCRPLRSKADVLETDLPRSIWFFYFFSITCLLFKNPGNFHYFYIIKFISNVIIFLLWVLTTKNLFLSYIKILMFVIWSG